jgi:aryl-alcohol dehydrogenase-like predicted oxidoreductase
MQQGLLSGKPQIVPTDLPEGRRRTRLYASSRSDKSRHGGCGVEQLVFGECGALEQMQSAAEAHGVSVPALSVGWLLSRPGVACVIVGASTAEQARRNAVPPELSPAALEAAGKASEALKAGLGAAYGGCVDQYAKESRIHGNGP